MFIHSDDKCPVCNNHFAQDDDVVFCPVCGTPHHRECYESLGHCFNESKHASGFEYQAAGGKKQEQNIENTTDAPEEEAQDYYTQDSEDYIRSSEDADKKNICPSCNAQIEPDAPFCSRCGARQENVQYRKYNPLNGIGLNYAESQQYKNDKRTIDGYSLSDIASVVRINTERFVSKFLKNKKLSWNWSAFIFGPYYLFYRKMYKQGAAFFALRLIIQYVLNGIYAKEIMDFASFFNANQDALMQMYTNPNTELLTQMQELYEPLMPMACILLLSALVLNILIAVFADGFYKSRVIGILNKVNADLDSGGMFSSVLPMVEEQTLSQEDMKKLYLGKMGGTSYLSPIVAWCALDIITGLVSRIISLF